MVFLDPVEEIYSSASNMDHLANKTKDIMHTVGIQTGTIMTKEPI